MRQRARKWLPAPIGSMAAVAATVIEIIAKYRHGDSAAAPGAHFTIAPSSSRAASASALGARLARFANRNQCT
jgi:hypothetical protein